MNTGTHDPTTLPTYLSNKVSVRRLADCPVPGPCWVWTARLVRGYGAIVEGDRHTYVHRRTYTLLVGSIPDGLEIDHLCLNKACCNPSHLEPVTHQENMIRYGKNKPIPEVCGNGHVLDSTNLRTRSNGRWRCAECGRTSNRAVKTRRRRARGAFERGAGICVNGHNLAEVGRYGDGNRCAQCGRDRSERHRARRLGGSGQLALMAVSSE